jgi:hypothetical protein
MKELAIRLLDFAALLLACTSRYNSCFFMSSPLAAAIANLCASELSVRTAGAGEIYRAGRSLADESTRAWRANPALAELLGFDSPTVTVGLAVQPATFAKIREANATPPLANVPPEQDAQEFELHFPTGILLDILTSRDPAGEGAIARFLKRFGEGIQQVEYRCMDVDRATAILKENLGVLPVYPQARTGADNTRINFFLVPTDGGGKVLIELYEKTGAN